MIPVLLSRRGPGTLQVQAIPRRHILGRLNTWSVFNVFARDTTEVTKLLHDLFGAVWRPVRLEICAFPAVTAVWLGLPGRILSGSAKRVLYISRLGVVVCYRNQLSWSFGQICTVQRFWPSGSWTLPMGVLADPDRSRWEACSDREFRFSGSYIGLASVGLPGRVQTRLAIIPVARIRAITSIRVAG